MQDYPIPGHLPDPPDLLDVQAAGDAWVAERTCTKCGYVSARRLVPDGPASYREQDEPDPLPVVTITGAPRPEDDGVLPVCATCLQLALALLRNPRAIVTIGLEPTAAHSS